MNRILLFLLVLFIPSFLCAADISFFMWDNEVSGFIKGEHDLGGLGSGAVDATIEPDRTISKGARLVLKLFSIPTEFAVAGLKNGGGLTAEGDFTFKGVDFDTDQPMDYDMDTTVIDLFPRLPLFKRKELGIDLLLGFKAVFLDTTVSGVDKDTGEQTSSNLDSFVPFPMIGARVYLGDLKKKKFRVEAMARYFRLSLYGSKIKALDAEVLMYTPIGGTIDFFAGWRWREQEIELNIDDSNQAGQAIDSDGLFYGLRYRF